MAKNKIISIPNLYLYYQITYFHIENDYILPMSPEEKAIIDSNYDEIVVENYDYNQFDYNNHRGPII